MDNPLTIDELYELFECDAMAGVLVWKVRPDGHFATARAAAIINARNGGRRAGSLDGRGYWALGFNWRGQRVKTYAHRVIWAMHHGAWPTHTIDHRDGPAAGDGIENLREATQAEQPLNMRPRKSATGLRGAYRNGPGFQAKMKHEGRVYRFGQFQTAEEAHAAYLEGRAKLNAFQPVPRDE